MDKCIKKLLVNKDLSISNAQIALEKAVPNNVHLTNYDVNVITSTIRSTLFEINKLNEIQHERRHAEILSCLQSLRANISNSNTQLPYIKQEDIQQNIPAEYVEQENVDIENVESDPLETNPQIIIKTEKESGFENDEIFNVKSNTETATATKENQLLYIYSPDDFAKQSQITDYDDSQVFLNNCIMSNKFADDTVQTQSENTMPPCKKRKFIIIPNRKLKTAPILKTAQSLTPQLAETKSADTSITANTRPTVSMSASATALNKSTKESFSIERDNNEKSLVVMLTNKLSNKNTLDLKNKPHLLAYKEKLYQTLREKMAAKHVWHNNMCLAQYKSLSATKN